MQAVTVNPTNQWAGEDDSDISVDSPPVSRDEPPNLQVEALDEEQPGQIAEEADPPQPAAAP